jgi:hypothetical protein
MPLVATITAVAAMLALILLTQWQPVNTSAVVLQVLEGDVWISHGEERIRAQSDQVALTAGDEVITGEAGIARVSFGGEKVQVELFPESRLRVEQVVMEKSLPSRIVLRCNEGRMAAKIQSADDSTEVIMHAYDNLLSSTGGEFTVGYLPDHSTAVDVESGGLYVANAAGTAEFHGGDSVLLWHLTAPGEPLDFPLVPNSQP